MVNLLYTDHPLDDDDDDLNEQDIPSFTAPNLSPPVVDKGKARTPDPVAQTNSAGALSQGASGNIGTSNVPHKPAQQTVGGPLRIRLARERIVRKDPIHERIEVRGS